MRSWSRTIGKPLLALAATVLALGAAELGVRLLGSAPEVIPIGITNDANMFRRSPNPILSYEHKPNYRNSEADPRYNFPSINSVGLRDVERTFEKPPGKKRVLVLGDSVVAGYGVREIDDLMTRQLERLYSDGSVEVLNLGVSGYSTRAEVELLKEVGLKFDPDLVILVFVENDFANFHRETHWIEGLRARPAWASWLFRTSDLFRLASLKLNLFGFGQEADPAYWNQRALGDNNVADGLELLRQLAEANNFEVLVASWPHFSDDAIAYSDAVVMPGRPDELIVDRLARMVGIASVGLAEPIRQDWQARFAGTNPRRQYTTGDELHPSVEGHRVAALVFKQLIDSQQLLAEDDVLQTLGAPAARDEAALAAARMQGSDKSDYALIHLNRGIELVREGKLDEGIPELKEAMRINPKYAGAAHYEMGVALRKQGTELDKAADHLARAVGINPQDWEFRAQYGLALQAQGKYDAAIAQFSAAIEREPESGYLHHLQGAALREAGRLPEAAERYADATRLAPKSAVYQNNYGNVLRLLEKYPEAIAQFEKALELEPNMREAQFNLALTLASSGDTEAAMRRLEQLLAAHPEDAEAHYTLGVYLAGQGKNERAIGAFKRAVALRPAYTEAWNNLGAVLLSTDRAQQAVDPLEHAVELAADSAAAHANLAEAYAKVGRRTDAQARARQALTIAQARGDAALVKQLEALLDTLSKTPVEQSRAVGARRP